MATNNAINLRAAGIPVYDNVNGTFSAVALTKGQLLTFDGTNAVYFPLPVGTNGQVLSANSATDSGLQWVAAGGGGGPGGVTAWTVVTGTTQSMAVNNGYVANNASLVTFTLPATAAVGSTLRVTGLQGDWLIAQGSGQSINFGDVSTTVGAGGSLGSTESHDAVELVCVVANTTWQVVNGPQGNLEYI